MDGRAWVMPLSIRIALILLTPINRSYGTPFLLSLGLSEQLTSLVWLAGPLGGLIAQPIIGGSKPFWILHRNLTKSPSGAISDSSHSKYRRRYWVVLSTAVLCISTLILAYCQGIAAFFVDLFGGGAGDWDPKRIKQVSIDVKILDASHCRAGVRLSNRARSSLLLSSGLCYQCSPSISSEPSPRCHSSRATERCECLAWPDDACGEHNRLWVR